MSEGLSNGLIIFGSILQAVGFVLALVDLHVAKASVRQYKKRPQVIEAGKAFESEVAFPVGMMAGGKEPTVEERLERLELELAEERSERQESIRRVGKRFDEKLDQVTSTVERAARREIKALVGLVASPPSRREWSAMVLFVVGLASMTAGSVIG